MITATNILSVNMTYVDASFADIAYRYKQLPRHVAYKHMAAAMKRAIRKAQGVQTLKQVCRERLNLKGTVVTKDPPKRTKAGTFKKGWNRRRRGGEFLKAIAVVSSKPKGGKNPRPLVAKIGWRYGEQSKKAIWLEFGTSRGVKPRRMAEETFMRIRGPAMAGMKGELVYALSKAVKDLGQAKDPKKRKLAARIIAGGTW
jgi:hypothetical protein